MGRNRKNRVIKEFKGTNLNQDLFLASIGAWLVGRSTEVRLRTSSSNTHVVTEALEATKSLHEELHRPHADLGIVMDKLNAKNAAVQNFERTFGLKWPL